MYAFVPKKRDTQHTSAQTVWVVVLLVSLSLSHRSPSHLSSSLPFSLTHIRTRNNKCIYTNSQTNTQRHPARIKKLDHKQSSEPTPCKKTAPSPLFHTEIKVKRVPHFLPPLPPVPHPSSPSPKSLEGYTHGLHIKQGRVGAGCAFCLPVYKKGVDQ